MSDTIDIELAKRFDAIRPELPEVLKKADGYKGILQETLKLMFPDPDYGEPDWETIHVINDGDYQGTFVFLVPSKTYQPSTYLLTKVYYGSCGGCDTLQAIYDYESEYDWDTGVRTYTEEGEKSLITLALHLIQKARWV
jgi:hypothetical protein